LKSQKVFVLGDIHGAFRGLIQCLARAEFDYENDHLIFLGDVCDGWSETALCIEELLKIKHLIYVLGNHDLWAIDWAMNGNKPEIWLRQGGQATVDSYPDGMPESHLKLLRTAFHYYLSGEKLFVHAGIKVDIPLEQQDQDIFLWDRSLYNLVTRLKNQGEEINLSPYQEIYIGHTPTTNMGIYHPINACNVWLMDTGAGWDGSLSMMNISTKECFQSDRIKDLYPREKGRS